MKRPNVLLLLGASVMLVLNIAGCDQSNGFSIGERFKFGGRFGGADPVLAPDGGTIFFAAPGGERLGNIFAAAVANGESKPVIAAAGYQGQPYISPDGRSIVYVSEQAGLPAIWMANIDGTGPRRITSSQFAEDSPIFSSDGTRAAFVRRLTQNPDDSLSNEVFVIGIDGSNERRVTVDESPELPLHFTPDGRSLYVVSEGDCNGIQAPAARGANLYKIALEDLTTIYIVSLGNYLTSALSADEKTVVYVGDSKTNSYDVFSVNLDGSNRRQLTTFGAYIGSVRFGFHSDRFTFLVEPTSNGTGDIYLYELSMGRQKKITSTSSISD